MELFKETKRDEEAVLRIHTPKQYLNNLCRKTFLHRFARETSPLWKARHLGPMELTPEVNGEVILPDVDSGDDRDPEADPEDAWEWRRLYHTDDGVVWDLFCCPEDILRTEQCAHRNSASIDENYIICKNCLVP